MQAITRRFGHKAVNQSSSISSLRSLYPISDHHCYGADFPRFASTLAPMGTSHLLRRGTGGRSSVSGIIATVFGATGFLGRYVVQQLAKMGSQVLVPFRGSEDSHRHLKVMGDLGQIVPMKYDPRDESSIKAVMAKANVVVNLIGRDYATRNYSFDQVNYHMAEQLAQISKEHGGIMRFIQVSCLGASPSAPSKMLRAKAAAEESIMRELPEATIMKPAVMVGTEDRILNRWAAFAKKYGFLPLIGDGSTKIQPVYVVDVAAAIVAALRDDGSSMGKVFELGGPDIYTIHELAELMHETIREYSRYVHVPVPIAKAIAMPRELLLNKVPFPLPTPEMVNLDTVDAITTDTLVSGNDVISIPKTNENFRLLYDTKGRFRLHSILKEEEAKYKNTTEAAVAGAKSIAMSSIKSGTVRRLIYTASVAAYSPLKNNGSGYKEFMDETCSTPLDLVCSSSNDFFTAYTDSKTLAEKEILSYSSGNFEVVTLACGLVGGDTVISYTPTSVAMYVSQITNNAVAYQGLKYGFLKLKHGGGIEPKTKEVSTEDDVIIGGNQSIWL